ncbi:MAG: class I SAM-dependent methyltransferase [Candidatus Eisenbacteria bacterium]
MNDPKPTPDRTRTTLTTGSASGTGPSADAYGDIRYRGLIAWSDRLDREWPFLTKQLERAPDRSVVDLGCGPGEHVARFAHEGWRALGVDRSPAQIEDARAHHPTVPFEVGAMEELANLTEDRFGAALCLGNALPSLDDAQMAKLLAALSDRLAPGGVFLVQWIDYEPILAGRKRALPVTVRPGRYGSETVFVRVYAPDPDPRFVHFLPTTLELPADRDTPLQLTSGHRIRHRGWTADELTSLLRAHGFRSVERFGGMDGSPHEAGRSQDVVLVATKA